MLNTKKCNKCFKDKNILEFPTIRNGISSRCRSCWNYNRVEWYHNRGGKKNVRNRILKTKYGITIEDYDKLLAEQNGVCAGCLSLPSKNRFHVDHNHATGKIRGLLCYGCNHVLGIVKDNKNTLSNLMRYLNERI